MPISIPAIRPSLISDFNNGPRVILPEEGFHSTHGLAARQRRSYGVAGEKSEGTCNERRHSKVLADVVLEAELLFRLIHLTHQFKRCAVNPLALHQSAKFQIVRRNCTHDTRLVSFC